MPPRSLYKNWFRVEEFFKKSSKIFLMLDYDGTIVPITKKPELAKLKNKAKKILLKLICKEDRFRVAIISGRSIHQLKQLINLKNLYYVGLHGLEIKGPSLKFTHELAIKTKPTIIRVRTELSRFLQKVNGVVLEDKGLTLAVHYRLVSSQDSPFVKRKVLEVQTKYEGLRLLKGKKVFEFIPDVDWDKGDAALYLLKSFDLKHTPVYVGDDKTDENAFKVLRNLGLTIVVGRKKNSIAEYYVKNVGEVLRFLQKVSVM
ncbi:trehalose-phosphatase [Candidatus Bathyarchaeota archaeon]|nr:MAG: trehalose-phosphatase [Candidatus Bathyarchaeota archaeon]